MLSKFRPDRTCTVGMTVHRVRGPAPAYAGGGWPQNPDTVEPRLATHRVQHHPRASIGNSTACDHRPEGRWEAHNHLLSEQS